MKKYLISFFLLLLFVTHPVILYAQSLYNFNSLKADTVENKNHKEKSPTLAMLYSALLPGSGQFYNESYWKIPIILGLAAYWGYEWNDLNNSYRNYKNLYSKSLSLYPPYGNYQYKVIRDFYRTERDKFAWYLGILYFANILDAYVDANLFNFDVGDDLSFGVNKETNKCFSINIYLKIRK